MRHRDLGRQGGGEGQLTVSLFFRNETLCTCTNSHKSITASSQLERRIVLKWGTYL
jgi:hypothetical protein